MPYDESDPYLSTVNLHRYSLFRMFSLFDQSINLRSGFNKAFRSVRDSILFVLQSLFELSLSNNQVDTETLPWSIFITGHSLGSNS